VTSQLQIQHDESHVHQQMMNVMLMALMQNICGGSNQQQRTQHISEQPQHDTANNANNNK
jgi:hypothetical protein